MSNPFPDDNAFRKSSYSDRQNCVEIADLDSGTAVRDSQHPNVGHLEFSIAEWRAFLDEVKRGQL